MGWKKVVPPTVLLTNWMPPERIGALVWAFSPHSSPYHHQIHRQYALHRRILCEAQSIPPGLRIQRQLFDRSRKMRGMRGTLSA